MPSAPDDRSRASRVNLDHRPSARRLGVNGNGNGNGKSACAVSHSRAKAHHGHRLRRQIHPQTLPACRAGRIRILKLADLTDAQIVPQYGRGGFNWTLSAPEWESATSGIGSPIFLGCAKRLGFTWRPLGSVYFEARRAPAPEADPGGQSSAARPRWPRAKATTRSLHSCWDPYLRIREVRVPAHRREMHMALASTSENRAFAPETLRLLPGDSLINRCAISRFRISTCSPRPCPVSI